MKKYFLQILLSISLVYFTACSSSSNSVRYGTKTETKKEVDNSVRFTSKESNKNTAKNSENPDPEFDEQPPTENPTFRNKLRDNVQKFEDFTPQLSSREKILMEIIKYIDTPYQYGGNSYKGIDCSAFTQNVYNNSTEVELPRTASQQFEIGEKIADENDLQFGDLVFFNTTKRSYPGHVGIYVGQNLFAHASRTLGVTISSLDESYYSRRYIGARRIK